MGGGGRVLPGGPRRPAGGRLGDHGDPRVRPATSLVEVSALVEEERLVGVEADGWVGKTP